MTTKKVFDALLVLQHQSGDKKALGLLVKRHHHRLCRHSFWYTRDIDAAQDIVQDCWGIIIKKLNGLRDPNTFGSWALRIVTRKSLDFLDSNKYQREKLKAMRAEDEDREAAELRQSDIQRLQKAIRSLPHDQQVVLKLFYTQEYSLKEIGGILDISVGTVKSRLFHAREKLKSILKK